MSSPETLKSIATLVRGEVYYLKDVRFDRGLPVVISDDMREHLEEHAVDTVTTSDSDDEGEVEVIHKAKFEFRDYDGDVEPGKPLVEAPKAKREVQPATVQPARTRSRTRG